MKVELFGDFSKMDGTILSIKAPGQEPAFILTASNDTKVRAQKSAVTGIVTDCQLVRLVRKSHSGLGKTQS